MQRLNLGSNQLSGPIPAALSELSALQHLDLGENQLSGTIPAVLGELSALQYLSLDGNQLSGAIPDALGELSALQHLSLYNNQLSGPIPAVLGELSALEWLRLDYNHQLSGAIPAALGELSALELLRLDHNQLSGPIPAALGKLSALEHLTLYNNQLTTLPPGVFDGLDSLTLLDLSNNPGAPFALTLELARADNLDLSAPGPASITVNLAQGAPFSVSVDLSVTGGTLSSGRATIAPGQTASTVITVTPSGDGPVTVTLGTPLGFDTDNFRGLSDLAIGSPLTLFSDEFYAAGMVVTATTDGSIGWSAESGKYPGASLANTLLLVNGVHYQISEFSYHPTQQRLSFTFAGGEVPDDINNLMLSFNPDVAFRDAVRDGATFTWTGISAVVSSGERITLRLNYITVAEGAQADMNQDGKMDYRDALVMYYAYTLGRVLGDGNSGGNAGFRRALLGGLVDHSSIANPNDDDFKALLRQAGLWKNSARSDLNGDGTTDHRDALVMYYAYTLGRVLGDGNSGGNAGAGFRRALLGGLVDHGSIATPNDDDFKTLLRKANSIR